MLAMHRLAGLIVCPLPLICGCEPFRQLADQSADTGCATAAKGKDYFPPPESQGGWRKLSSPEDIRRLAGMDPAKLQDLNQWLLASDDRPFAAVVATHAGYRNPDSHRRAQRE